MNCKNCNITLSETDDFCRSCGAKTIRNRLTVKNLLVDFGEQYFNLDNKLLQTFIKLFTKPEDVIDSYINGTRKKYVNVISYIAIAITFSGLLIFIINKFFPDMMDFSVFASPGQEEFQKKNVAFVQEYQSILMILYVPAYALMAKLTFIGLKKYNFTELNVVFFYIQAQMSIALFFITLIFVSFGVKYGEIGIFVLPLMILYGAWVLKRLYNLTIGQIILRTLLFLLILGIALTALSIVVAIILFMTGDMDAMIEAQKTAKEASGN